jgi:membrane protease YdiL (CAAX protease family)
VYNDKSDYSKGGWAYLAGVWHVIGTRQVLVYLALDISIVVILCLCDPLIRDAFAQVPLWYWPLLYVPFALLARFENPNAPLIFNRGMRKRTMAASALLIWALLLGVFTFLYAILSYMPYMSRFQLALPVVNAFVSSALLNLHAGLSEEPFKVFWINGIAWVFRRKAWTDSAKRDLLWVGGTASILFWDYLHVLLSNYTLFEFTVAFFVGLLLFLAVLRTGNLLVAIAAHALYDFFMSHILILILTVIFIPR